MDSEALVWMDLEMTGLKPETDKILEIAVVLTDKELLPMAPPLEFVIHQSDDTLNAMDAWCQKTHGESGLIEKVRHSTWTEAAVSAEILTFLKTHLEPRTVPLCGNSIWQDRRFIAKYLPDVDQFLHYRCVDVSTMKELARRWRPGLVEQLQKQSAHTALLDIQESIQELAFYRAQGFVG